MLAAALAGVPIMFAALALFVNDMLRSTWTSGVMLFSFVIAGLFALWRIQFPARWLRPVSMLIYAPLMFFALAWLGVMIQLANDDCAAHATKMACGFSAPARHEEVLPRSSMDGLALLPRSTR